MSGNFFSNPRLDCHNKGERPSTPGRGTSKFKGSEEVSLGAVSFARSIKAEAQGGVANQTGDHISLPTSLHRHRNSNEKLFMDKALQGTSQNVHLRPSLPCATKTKAGCMGGLTTQPLPQPVQHSPGWLPPNLCFPQWGKRAQGGHLDPPGLWVHSLEPPLWSHPMGSAGRSQKLDHYE